MADEDGTSTDRVNTTVDKRTRVEVSFWKVTFHIQCCPRRATLLLTVMSTSEPTSPVL